MLNILSDIMDLKVDELTTEQKNLLRGPSEVFLKLELIFI